MNMGARRLNSTMTGLGFLLVDWSVPSAIEEVEFILDFVMTFDVCQQMCINQTYSIEIPSGVFREAHNATSDVPAACTGNADRPSCAYESGTDGCPEGCDDDGVTCSGTADPPTCDLDVETDETAQCPQGCTFTASYTPWVERSEILHEQTVPCIGIEFFPKWASVVWNASTRVYDIKQSTLEAGPVQAEQAETIVQIGSCGYYHVQSTPQATFDSTTNTSATPCVWDRNLFNVDGCWEPIVGGSDYSTGSFFLAGSPGTGTFQPAPWSYILGNESFVNATDNTSMVDGPFGGIGNFSVFQGDQEVELEEGQVYLLGWNLLEGHGTSRNSFLQFSNGSCSPSFSDRIRLFDPAITPESPFPGYAVSEKLHDGTEVFDTSHNLSNTSHIGAAYVTAPVSGKFKPTPILTRTTNTEFTGCTDPDAVNFNTHAFVDGGGCKYTCEFTWTPTNYNVTYSAEKAVSSSHLPHDTRGGAPARDIMAAFDGAMATSYHSNQGTPSETNPVELQYDFVELGDHQAIVQYAISSRCCDSPLAGPDAPRAWTVQGSEDGKTWFELSSVQNEIDWGSETRIFVIEEPVHCRFLKLAVTDVGGREATNEEGGLYNFLVLSELQFFVGEYLCSAAPRMRGYDVAACASAAVPDPEHDRNPCAKSSSFVFTQDRLGVVSRQGAAVGLALNFYEVVPCYHPDAVVCSTEQVFIPVGPPPNCSLNVAEESATCVDRGSVCASGTTGACPAGCTDDGSNCAGTATCELGLGGEEADCPTSDGCTYTPRTEAIDYGMDSYKGVAEAPNVSACNETERIVLSRFWSTLEPAGWAQTECLVQRASLALLEPLNNEVAAVEIDDEVTVDKRIMLWESETKIVTVRLDVAPRHPVTVSLVPSSELDRNRSTTCMDAAFPQSPPAQCAMSWLGTVQDDCESLYCLNCPFAHSCDAMCEGYGYSYCESSFYGHGTQIQIEPAVAVFTPENWSTPLHVSVTGAIDFEYEDADHAVVTITPYFRSDDCHYNGSAPADMKATFILLENDCPVGYTGSVQTGCFDLDECGTNNGMCRADCYNLDGGYACGLCPDGTTGVEQGEGDWTRAGVLFMDFEIEFMRIDPLLPPGAGILYDAQDEYFFMWLSSPLYTPGNELRLKPYSAIDGVGEYYAGCCDDKHNLPGMLLVADETVHIGWEFFENITCQDRISRDNAPALTTLDPACGYHTDCASCLASTAARAPATGCGWCATTQQCLDGGKSGANYPHVCLGVWDYDQCPCDGMGVSVLQFSKAHDLEGNCTVNEEICPSTNLADYDNGCAKGIEQGYSCDYLDLHGVDCAQERYCGFCRNQYGVDAIATCMPLEEQNLNTCLHGGTTTSNTSVPTNTAGSGTAALVVPSIPGAYFINWYVQLPCDWSDAQHLRKCYSDTDGYLWTHDTNVTLAADEPELCWALQLSLPVNVSEYLPLPESRFYRGMSLLPNVYSFTLQGSIDVVADSLLYRNCSDFCIQNCYDWDGLWRFEQGTCDLISTYSV